MGKPDEDVSTLKELGLSSSQAKVYLNLAKFQTLTAQQISKNSGIARPHVYKVLAELENTGVVARIIGQPERFQAVTIEECVSILMRRRITKTAELQEKATVLSKSFKFCQLPEGPDEKTQFMLIPKRGAVYAKAEKMLKNVKVSIHFLGLTKRMIAWLSDYSSILEEALARRVECEMIMPQPEPSRDLWKPIKNLGDYPNFALRLIPYQPKFGFSIWDNNEVLITTSPVDSPTPATTLWSNNKGIVDLCKEHFCCLWEKAEKVHFKID